MPTNKKINNLASAIWFSLPVQLLLLHFKRYQLLLFIWGLLFATVNGSFMHRFGAHILFLYPEYLGHVNALSSAMVGVSVAVLVLSWNITTFILHAKQIRFLATATQPFLKYCVNNAIIPLAFLIFYVVKSIQYLHSQELLGAVKIIWLMGGFLIGFIMAITIGLSYFFGADVTIYRNMPVTVKDELIRYKNAFSKSNSKRERIRVDWYLSATLKLRKPRDVSHYTADVIDRILKQHHLAAVFSLLFAFVFLIISGYFLDNKYFQLPAAASITVFFAIIIAAESAFSYFLKRWSLLFAGIVFLLINLLYQQKILDPRNKAYGLNYSTSTVLPLYNKTALNALASPQNITTDSLAFIAKLENWKARQPAEKPILVMVCVSGGGARAATFTVNVLRTIDSLSQQKLMPSTFLISGASGGMMGAVWYRTLYNRKRLGHISHLQMQNYLPDISNDLLNPLFSTFVARDLITPPQYFWYKNKKYIKDRGYAFEQRLNANTHGWLNTTIADFKNLEDSAILPQVMMNAVVTRDGRKLIISPSPARFMMRPVADSIGYNLPDPDGLDFISFFKNQDAEQLGMLSAIRMNATFPYVLPNVWLPSDPEIDVMDAGFRDNTGLENSLRFLYFFKTWIKNNCSKIILLEIRDKEQGGWDTPFESNSVLDIVTKPALLTQNNLFRFQEYAQLEQLQWFKTQYGEAFQPILFQYVPHNKSAAASLSFHITQREKIDLSASLTNAENSAAFARFGQLIK